MLLLLVCQSLFFTLNGRSRAISSAKQGRIPSDVTLKSSPRLLLAKLILRDLGSPGAAITAAE